MAVVVESVSVNVETPVTLVTTASVTKPSGTTSGDLVLVELDLGVNDGSANDLNPTITGFTRVIYSPLLSSTNPTVAWFWKVAGGSEPSSYTANWSGANCAFIIRAYRISGADTTTPINASSPSSPSSPYTSPSITTTVNGCLLLWSFLNGRSDSTVTVPSGTTSIDNSAQASSTSGFRVRSAVATETQTTAGSTGTRTWTLTGTASGVVTASIAIAPAAGGGGSTYTLDATTAGSYALTGTAAATKLGRRTAAASGSYALSGTAATLKKGSRLAAGAASYSLTGTAAATLQGRKVAAAAGSYSLGGATAGLLHAWKVGAGAGSYVLTGTAAGLSKTGALVLAAGSGSYALAGTDAGLTTTTAAPASSQRDGDAWFGPTRWGNPRAYRPRLYAYDEPKKSEPVRRRAVTRKAVRTILRRTGALNQIVSLDEAMQAAPIEVEYAVPVNSDLTDNQLYYRAIRAALMQQAQWIEQQQRQHALMLEEEAIILALAA